VPYAAISWDERAFGFSRQQCADLLRAGDPQIEVIGGAYREVVQPKADEPFKEKPHTGEPERLIAIASNTLKPGEEKIIARRLKEILALASKRAGVVSQ
jgi:SRSO17 transposase